MALARYRNQIARLCRDVQNTLTNFLFPQKLTFGGAGSEGTSEAFVRADHIHALDAVPEETLDNLDNETLLFHEFLDPTTSSTVWNSSGTTVLGGRDDLGVTGAFGSVDVTAVGAASSASVLFTNFNTVDWTRQDFLLRRTRTIEMRVMPVDSTGEANDVRVACGMVRTGTNGSLNVQDGIYFLLDTDSVGDGNWQAKITVSGSDDFVFDTGVSYSADAGGDVAFQVFRIDVEETTDPETDLETYVVTYTIDGTIVATSNAESLGTAVKAAGIGCFLDHDGASGNKTMAIDYLLHVGIRVATA